MLRIMTLNINYYGEKHGSWPERRGRIVEVVRAARPDVIALQAVRRDPAREGGIGQSEQLAALAPEYMHVLFEAAARSPDGGAEGSALLSRLKPVSQAVLPLTPISGLDDKNRRVVISARFGLPGASLSLFNAHFSWVDEQAELNVAETLEFASSTRGAALLVGDLNQPPGSAAMQQFAASGWTDVWALLCPGEDGFTFEAGKPDKRIDYGWANQELAARLRTIEIVGGGRSGEDDLSDHLALLISIDL